MVIAFKVSLLNVNILLIEVNKLFLIRKAPPSQDQMDIQTCMALMNVSEYRLFELAYAEWFGSSLAESELELTYILYLFHTNVPYWVRHYVRNIRQLSDEAGIHTGTMGLMGLMGLTPSRNFSYAVSDKISAPSFVLTLLLSMLIVVL